MSRRRKSISTKSQKSSLLIGSLAILIFTCLALLIAIFLRYQSFKKANILDDKKVVSLVIPYGSSLSSVSSILENEGLIQHPIFFRLWALETGLAGKIRAGSYHFQGPLSLDNLHLLLQKGGSSNDVVLTIPEGYSIFKIADRVKSLGLGNRTHFLKAAKDPKILQEFAVPGESMEGYLFPNTYRFKKGTSADEMIRKMYGNWQKVWEDAVHKHRENYLQLAEKYNFSIHDFITLASIIQRETHIKKELPQIARVFYNRLDRKMKLQTDPTCVYGPNTYKLRPSPKLCHDPLNRYSTYIIQGLPPGPISNPGADAIHAVLNPSQSPEAQKYLYFVARQDRQGHTFSSTYRAHKKAVQLLKRK